MFFFNSKLIVVVYAVLLSLSSVFWAQSLECSRKLDGDCVGVPSVATHHGLNPKSALKITFITYSTPNIESYARYTFLINEYYARSHQHSLLCKSPQTGDNFDRNDQRWNKVKILYNEVNLRINDSGVNYLVWLDADLFIANHSFYFGDIIGQHNESDIIISREVDPANGIANSGCFMVKVSSWSLTFLDTWWSAWDHTTGMDQHVFDHLYHNLPTIADHITLLPFTALNSRFPGLIHHRDEDPILHLAGESNFIRQHIIEIAWNGLNDPAYYHDTHPDWILPPFGLSRNVLDSINYTQLHEREWNRILQQISNANSAQDWDAASLQAMQYDIREAQQSLSKFLCTYGSDSQQQKIADIGTQDKGCLNLKELFYNQTVDALQFVYERYMLLLSRHDEEPTLSLLQSSIDAVFELLTILRYSDESYQHIAMQTLQLIERMKMIVATQPLQMRIVLYYHFKLLEFTALYHLHHNNQMASVLAYEEALIVWKTMVGDYDYYGSGNGVMNSHAEGIALLRQLVALLCSSTSYIEGYNTRSNELMQLLEGYIAKDGLVMTQEDDDMTALRTLCMTTNLSEAENDSHMIASNKKKFRRKLK